jgi:hypothetical protein
MPREAVGITMPASHVMSLDIFAIDRTMIAGRTHLRVYLATHEAPYPRLDRLRQFPGHSWDIQVPTYTPCTLPRQQQKSLLLTMFTIRPSTIDHRTIDHRPCQPYKVTLEQHSYASLHLTSPSLSSSTVKPCSPAITTHK